MPDTNYQPADALACLQQGSGGVTRLETDPDPNGH